MLVASSARSDGGADLVVAEVAGATIHAGDVSRRLASMPDFQRRTLGKTADEIRRAIVLDVLAPEARFSAEARSRAALPAVRARLRDALRKVLVESLRDEVRREATPDAEIRAYYDAHRDDFERPERIRIVRILVEDEALARKLIAEAKSDDKSMDRWKQLAREHSVDAATKMRGGMLGFVGEDGKTDVPQLQVDPALFAAASKVRDGELVPEPVREGERFAVVWRRGTAARVSRSVESVRPIIEQVLQEQRLDKRVAELVAKQRATDVSGENPELLEALPPEPPAAPPLPKASGTPRAIVPTPKQTDRGLR